MALFFKLNLKNIYETRAYNVFLVLHTNTKKYKRTKINCLTGVFLFSYKDTSLTLTEEKTICGREKIYKIIIINSVFSFALSDLSVFVNANYK